MFQLLYTWVTGPSSIRLPASSEATIMGILSRGLRPPHIFGAAHHGSENLVVVGAAAEISGDPVGKLFARRVRIYFQESNRRHHEPRHAERALEPLLVNDRLLHGMQGAVRRLEPFDRDHLFPTDRVRKDRARIVRHVVDENGAGAALGAIAAKLGPRETQLVAQRHRQRFLLHHVDAALLTVDSQRHEPLDGPRQRALTKELLGSAEQVARRRHRRACGNDAFDELAPCYASGLFVNLNWSSHGAITSS